MLASAWAAAEWEGVSERTIQARLRFPDGASCNHAIDKLGSAAVILGQRCIAYARTADSNAPGGPVFLGPFWTLAVGEPHDGRGDEDGATFDQYPVRV